MSEAPKKPRARSVLLTNALQEIVRLKNLLEEFAQRVSMEGVPDEAIDANGELFLMPKEGTPEREAAEVLGTFADELYEAGAAPYFLRTWRARREAEVKEHRDNCPDCKARRLMAQEPATKWKN